MAAVPRARRPPKGRLIAYGNPGVLWSPGREIFPEGSSGRRAPDHSRPSFSELGCFVGIHRAPESAGASKENPTTFTPSGNPARLSSCEAVCGSTSVSTSRRCSSDLTQPVNTLILHSTEPVCASRSCCDSSSSASPVASGNSLGLRPWVSRLMSASQEVRIWAGRMTTANQQPRAPAGGILSANRDAGSGALARAPWRQLQSPQQGIGPPAISWSHCHGEFPCSTRLHQSPLSSAPDALGHWKSAPLYHLPLTQCRSLPLPLSFPLVGRGVALSEAPFAVAQRREFSKKGGKGGGGKKGSEGDRGAAGPSGKGEASAAAAKAAAEEAELAASVRDLHLFGDMETVIFSKQELERLLVEGFPVGLRNDFVPKVGGPYPTYPYIVRPILKSFINSLAAVAWPESGALEQPVNEEKGGDDSEETPGQPRSLENAGHDPGSNDALEAPELSDLEEGTGGFPRDSSPALAKAESLAEPLAESLAEPRSTSPAGSLAGSSARNRFLLLGPSGSGKSVLLALAAAWARGNGWLVLYVPKARDWVRDGLYFRHPANPLWDTPLQAQQVLQHLLAAHAPVLQGLPLRNRGPLSLSEAPNVDREPQQRIHRLPTELESPSLSLGELAALGVEERDASVSVLVRMREELERVEGVPVLIAIDEFNAWFSFSTYFESTGERSRRQIHSNELRMVRAFRPMDGSLSASGATGAAADSTSRAVMASAFSESIAVGRLAPRLPGIPRGASLRVPRFTLEESTRIIVNYLGRHFNGIPMEVEEDDILYAHSLAAGSGPELKRLSLLMV